MMAAVGTSVATVAMAMAWVTLSRAALTLPLDRCIDATTEQPAPIMRPRPVAMVNTGT